MREWCDHTTGTSATFFASWFFNICIVSHSNDEMDFFLAHREANENEWKAATQIPFKWFRILQSERLCRCDSRTLFRFLSMRETSKCSCRDRRRFVFNLFEFFRLLVLFLCSISITESIDQFVFESTLQWANWESSVIHFSAQFNFVYRVDKNADRKTERKSEWNDTNAAKNLHSCSFFFF